MADGAVKWRLHKCWRKRGAVTSSFELIGDGCGISSLRDSGIHFVFGVNLNAAINKWNAADAAGSSKKNPSATKTAFGVVQNGAHESRDGAGSTNQITHMIHGSSAMNVVDAVASVAVLHPAHNIMGEVSCEDI